MTQILYNSFAGLHGDRLLWALRPKELRILCYHGICTNDVSGAAWMPHYFVTASAFERQLQYLRRHARVLALGEAIARLREGCLPDRCVSITFDDGYRNNLTLGYPLLRKYSMPATIFLSSAFIESGELYPFLKLKLIRLNGYEQRTAPDYGSEPIDAVLRWADQWWPEVKRELQPEQLQALEPMTVEQVRAGDPNLIEFGAHTHTHCILRNENRDRRRAEIRESIRKVEEWTGRPVRFFAYPNGEDGDFGEWDKQVLREAGVEAAVTGMRGANDRGSEMMELRRFPIGLYHGDAVFRAEITGFRQAVLATRRIFG